MKTVQDSTFLSRLQVATLFGVTTRTIARWEDRDLLVPIRLSSRLLRYRKEDVEKLIEELAE